MPAPPTMVQEASVALSSTSPKTTAAFNVLRGDILIAYSTTTTYEETAAVANSGTDLGWTAYQTLFATGRPGIVAWAAPVIEDVTGLTATFTKTSGPQSISGTVLTLRGASAIGVTGLRHAHSGQPSLTLRTSQANSLIVNIGSHQGDTDGSGRAWRTTDAGAVTEVTYAVLSGEHVEIVGYHADVGAPGLKEVGLTGLLDGFQAYAFVAMEVVTADLAGELLYTKGR